MNGLVSFGVDGFSLFLVRLTTFLIPLCVLSGLSSDLKGQEQRFFGSRRLREGCTNLVFLALDSLRFYVGFEAVLLPMYRRIGVFGSRRRKIRASYLFFIFTLVGSVLMLRSRVVRYLATGSLSLSYLSDVSLPFELVRRR